MKTTDIHPELITAIQENLNSWREMNNSNYTPSNTQLRSAINNQRHLGWRNLVDGFWDTSWRKIQEQHMRDINSQKSALLWLCKVQRRIWKIAWAMWEDRNEQLHSNSSIHPEDKRNINKEIIYEWKMGQDKLSSHYSGLFQGTLERKLKSSSANKRNWLFNVWSAREKVDEAYLVKNENTQPATSLRFNYIRWKKRL